MINPAVTSLPFRLIGSPSGVATPAGRMSRIRWPSMTISTGPSLGRASSPTSARHPIRVFRTCSAQFSQSECDRIVQRPRHGGIHPMRVERVHLVVVALDVEQKGATGITRDAIHCHQSGARRVWAARMSALGPTFRQCPLYPKSGHRRARSPCPLCACQKQTYAVQQISTLFDHLVGARRR